VGQDTPPLAGLPEPGEPVFYPKVGHCIYRGVTQDAGAPGTELLELEDLEEGSRILIPLARVPELNLRSAGAALDEIKEVLSSKFEETIEDEDERHKFIETLITDGTPKALALSLKRLHLLRQTAGLSREEELTRKKIRSWLAAEVSLSKECTRAEAQAFMTRALQDSMSEHQKREKEEAKLRRRAAREQKKAEEAEAAARAEAALRPVFSVPEPEPEPESKLDATEPVDAAPVEPNEGESEIAAETSGVSANQEGTAPARRGAEEDSPLG